MKLVLLDLDGVLVDFHKGVCAIHNQPYQDTWIEPELWGMTKTEFWRRCDEDFWANLEPMFDMQQILDVVCKAVEIEKVGILTAAPHSSSYAMEGKRRWIEKHIPKLKERVIFGSAKYFCARQDTLLIDDKYENCEKFVYFGGYSFLYPRPWNGGGDLQKLDNLRDLLEGYLQVFLRK